LSQHVEATNASFAGMLKNYTAGINYAIDTTADLPLEFHLLGITPTKWNLDDLFTVEKIMDKMLTFGDDDVQRTILRKALTDAGYPTAMDELYPRVAPFEKPITVDYGHYPDEHLIAPFETDPVSSNLAALVTWMQEVDENAPIPTREGFGSNNWVVNSTRSATGKPILCNDMHLEWSLPMIWYEAHLVAADTGLDVQGFTLVGTPFIIVGHNQNIAWGMTNAGADHIDWYQYNENGTHYLYNGSWLPYETTTEYIPVKGQGLVPFTIKSTIHGPVMDPGNLPYTTGSSVAFKWVAITNYTTTYEAIYGFDHATNMSEFNAALAKFSIPSQNIVYADRFGNISIRCSGWVPIRHGITSTSNECRFLLNGSAGEHEWTADFIPFADWPHSENPDQGYLASANQLSTGPSYAYYYQDSMDTGYRGRRINDLLAANSNVSVDDMARIQNDVYDKIAEWFVPEVLSVFNNDTEFPAFQKTTLINDSIAILQAWDSSADKCQMYANLSAPTIYRAILIAFQEKTYDEFASFSNEAFFGYPQASVLENLTLNAKDSSWFDNVSTESIDENCSDIIRETIKEAISWLSTNTSFAGTGPDAWLYGQAHHVYWHHLTYLSALSAGPYEASGSGITVNPSSAGLFGNAMGGPSERMIIDFSHAGSSYFNTSRIVIPGGSNGDPVSPHYTDELQLFLNGQYHPLYYYPSFATFPIESAESRWDFI